LIPFEGGAMPAYFIPAVGFAGARRPTIIFSQLSFVAKPRCRLL
jgi:hypothetical protein